MRALLPGGAGWGASHPLLEPGLVQLEASGAETIARVTLVTPTCPPGDWVDWHLNRPLEEKPQILRQPL